MWSGVCSILLMDQHAKSARKFIKLASRVITFTLHYLPKTKQICYDQPFGPDTTQIIIRLGWVRMLVF